MKRILVPTDFSAEADYALDFAVEIARKAGAEILLVHVIESFQHFAFKSREVTDNFETDALVDTSMRLVNNQIDRLLEKRNLSGVKFVRKIKVGNPFFQLTKNLTEEGEDVDLAVIGTKGVSGLDEVIIGSNAERLMRHAKFPVITVKQETLLTDVKKVLFASFFSVSEHESRLTSELTDFLSLSGAELHLLHIIGQENTEAEKAAYHKVSDYAQRNKLKPAGIKIKVFPDIENGIHQYAKEINADVIAISAGSRTALRSLMADKISGGIVNHSKRMTWTVRR